MSLRRGRLVVASGAALGALVLGLLAMLPPTLTDAASLFTIQLSPTIGHRGMGFTIYYEEHVFPCTTGGASFTWDGFGLPIPVQSFGKYPTDCKITVQADVPAFSTYDDPGRHRVCGVPVGWNGVGVVPYTVCATFTIPSPATPKPTTAPTRAPSPSPAPSLSPAPTDTSAPTPSSTLAPSAPPAPTIAAASPSPVPLGPEASSSSDAGGGPWMGVVAVMLAGVAAYGGVSFGLRRRSRRQ